MLHKILKHFEPLASRVPQWSLRLVEHREEQLRVRCDVVEPPQNLRSLGAMISVTQDGGSGYAATSDLSLAGLARALEEAGACAALSAHRPLFSLQAMALPSARGAYTSPVREPWEDWPLKDKLDLLKLACQRLHCSSAILDRTATLGFRRVRTLLASSAGADLSQEFSYLSQGLAAVANQDGETQRRSFGREHGSQGGLERVLEQDLVLQAERVGEEAIALLSAPNCPSGPFDVLLMPQQMVLQIHESIGHPLELDRILGDERNYAGGSFVTPEMFGHYQYGSDLLNVSFDPGVPGEYAAYAYDDEGSPAERALLIEKGLLLRPLGGASSQARAQLEGVACARASDWNRPPIDRMANLNLEPGSATFAELVSGIENGMLMDTNRSWSIDDKRNKFQFGCEIGRRIEHGKIGDLVKNPNYRGVSASFWRSLAAVGDATTFEVLGVSNCGKGEPNQMIHVGHAAPACVFRSVDVFGA